MRFVYGLLAVFFWWSGFLASVLVAMEFIVGPKALNEGKISGLTLFLMIVLGATYSGIAWLLHAYYQKKAILKR
ncbi:MAG: hypothetical protein Q7R63_00875 [bacterium]|nr:hypothetical protein [bacterium]